MAGTYNVNGDGTCTICDPASSYCAGPHVFARGDYFAMLTGPTLALSMQACEPSMCLSLCSAASELAQCAERQNVSVVCHTATNDTDSRGLIGPSPVHR
jgi:hypothetical protein